VSLLLCGIVTALWQLDRAQKKHSQAIVVAIMALVVVMDLGAWHRERAFFHHLYLPQNGFADTAQWLRDNTPEDARIAAWTAGQLGQYSERSVINMEGLVADRELYKTYDSMDPAQYMYEKKITHVANHYPDFENGLTWPGMKRPDWVEIDTYPPSLNMLWDALTVPDITRGARYTRWGWNVFWAHRYRPLWDYPEAFKVVYKQRTQMTSIYIFEVDRIALQSAIAARAMLSPISLAKIYPFEAEENMSGEAVRAVLYLPRSSVYAVTGERLEWDVEVPFVQPGNYQVYALMRPGIRGTTATATLGDETYSVNVEENKEGGWRMIPLLETAVPLKTHKITLSITGLSSEPFDINTREETAAYMDQWFVVEESAIPQFESASSNLLTWMNREPHIPLDPDPTPPRMPTDF
jgi:hypothetical protein